MKEAMDALIWDGEGSPRTELKIYGRTLAELARQRQDIVCLSADLTTQTETDFFRSAHPERFFSMGMAEQNMIGVASGMARSGENPFVHSFSCFISRRCFDQVVNAVAYPRQRVRLVGFMPGISSPGGASHQAIDDLAILRATPNMTVIDLGEATEISQAVSLAADVDGPVYLRLRRGELPVLLDGSKYKLALGESYLLRQGTEIGIIASGMMTERALGAARLLADKGLSTAVLHVPSIKPIDEAGIRDLARRVALIVSLDNHTMIGGLGSAVAEVLADAGGMAPLLRLGLRDTYAWAGSRQYLYRLFGLDPDQIAAAVEARLEGRPLPVYDAAEAAARRGQRGWAEGF